MKPVSIITIGLLASPFMAHAEKSFIEGDKTYVGEAELGATLTTGNTDTSSLKGRLKVKHRINKWENQYLLEGLYKEDSDEITAKRYYLGFQTNYKFDESSYVYASANYEADPFTGFDFKTVFSSGYGYQFIDDSDMSLKAEIGPGYIYKQLTDKQSALRGYENEENVIAHSVVTFSYNLSPSSKFSQLLVADYGDGLEGRSETSITANIIGALAMKFAVIVRYNSEALDNKKSTDTETNMTLLYSF